MQDWFSANFRKSYSVICFWLPVRPIFSRFQDGDSMGADGLDVRLHRRLAFVGNSNLYADIPQGVYIAF